MTKGKVVLVPFPFDDLSAAKVRPAVCLTNPIGAHRHIVVAFITSQRPIDIGPTDVSINANDPDFQETGLRVSSTLRLHRLITISASIILRELGELPEHVQAQVTEKIRQLFD